MRCSCTKFVRWVHDITHRKSAQYVDDIARHCIHDAYIYVAAKLSVKSSYLNTCMYSRLFILGKSHWQFRDKQSRMQRTGHVIDGRLRICRVLDTSWNHVLTQLCRLRCRLWRLVLPDFHFAGVHQQLCQPFHLRRQVPGVSAGRQTSVVEIESTISSGRHCLTCNGRQLLFLVLWHIAITHEHKPINGLALHSCILCCFHVIRTISVTLDVVSRSLSYDSCTYVSTFFVDCPAEYTSDWTNYSGLFALNG